MKKMRLNMKEDFKYETIKELVDHNGNKKHAALKLGLSVRQINRLIKIYKEKGKSGFVHGNRNRQPVNSLPQHITNQIIKLYSTKYKGFNFSHFNDMLKEKEKINVSYSTIYTLLNDADISSPKIRRSTKRKKIKEQLLKNKPASFKDDVKAAINHIMAIEDAHPRKQRPKYFGEVVQMDGSIHNWFNSFKTTLHLAVDYSTGRVLGGYFDKEETLFGYYTVFKQILMNYGIPHSFLTDNRTVFNYMKDNFKKDHKDVLTQFGYACRTLGVSIETSSISQYKGLVERDNATFQDRLVNELRLYGIDNIDGANKYLTEIFIPAFNQKFSIDYKESDSVMEHAPNEDKINLILAVLSPRKFDCGSSIKYDNSYYQAYDRDDNLVCFRNRTECLVIKSYTNELYVSVDEQVFKLIKCVRNKPVSEEFDQIKIDRRTITHNIPPMSHPWKRASFIQQQQRAHKQHTYA